MSRPSVLLVLLVVLTLVPRDRAVAQDARTASPVATPGQDLSGPFQVGDRSLFLDCRGTGSPTVIIEHGQGGSGRDMATLQRELASDTRVCTYDRAGQGRSDPVSSPSTIPRTAADVVDDLHRLLEAAAVPGPYVLVGQSAGGVFVQLYARTYPDEVAGVVAMNAVPPWSWLKQAGPLMTEQERADEAAYYRGAGGGEGFDWITSFAQIEAAPAPPAVPFLVLISTIAQCERPDDVCGRTYAVYETVMTELALAWPQGEVQQVEAGHELYHYPEAVAAIRDLIAAAR